MAIGNDLEFHECPRVDMKAIMSAIERGGGGVFIAAIHASIEREGSGPSMLNGGRMEMERPYDERLDSFP